MVPMGNNAIIQPQLHRVTRSQGHRFVLARSNSESVTPCFNINIYCEEQTAYLIIYSINGLKCYEQGQLVFLIK